MSSFFTRKYIRVPIVALVILSLVLQMAPSPKPAQASMIDNALNWLQNKLSKISLPNITISEDGGLYLGKWRLFDCLTEDCPCVEWEKPAPPEPLNLNNLLNTAKTEYNKRFAVGAIDPENHVYHTCDDLLNPKPPMTGELPVDLCIPTADPLVDGVNPYLQDCARCSRIATCLSAINYMLSGALPIDIPGLQASCGDLNVSISETGEVSLEEKPKCLKRKCECFHPFSNFRLKIGGKEAKSQKTLISDEGELAIPELGYLPQCELKIPMPEDDQNLTTEQKLAQRKACTALIRIQKEAAYEVYLAKKIFNNTDPFTECLFVRNCRSSCAMKLGKFEYVITIADIANALLPTGVVTLIQKIMNVSKMIGEVTRVIEAIKTLSRDGIAIVQNIINVVHNVASFFEAASNMGLKMSDALIFGGGMVASSYLGDKLKGLEFKTGVDNRGNIGWLQKAKNLPGQVPGLIAEGATELGGWALTAGDGALGGVAATAVLNPKRAKEGADGLKEMLLSFAENNLLFSTAKSEALDLLDQITQDSEAVRSQFKSEPEIDFLFQENEDKRKLEKIKDEFLMTFESIDAFLEEMKQAGTLGKDETVLTFKSGREEAIPPEKDKPAKYTVSQVLSDGTGPNHTLLRFEGNPVNDVKILYKPQPHPLENQWRCEFEFPRVRNLDKCSSFLGRSDWQQEVSQVILGLPPYYPAHQIFPGVFIPDTTSGCYWFTNIKDIYSIANAIKIFLEPDYILNVVDRALSGCGKKGCENCYDCGELDYTKGPWVDYWATIREIMGMDWYAHPKQMDKVIDGADGILGLPFFSWIKEIETKSGNMSKNDWLDTDETRAAGPKGWVKWKVNEFVKDRDSNPDNKKRIGGFIEDNAKELSEKIEALWWQRAMLLAQHKYSTSSAATWRKDITPYWEEEIWSAFTGEWPPCIGVGGINNVETFFYQTYDSDIMYQNWDGNIEILVKAARGIDILRQALAWGISPQEPVMAYRIVKAQRDIDNLIATAGESITDQTVALVNQAINDTIGDLRALSLATSSSKYAYDNYVNCCACEKEDDARNLGTSNKSACGQVSNKDCCGAELTISCPAVEGDKCENEPAPTSDYLNYADTLDNLSCEVGLDKAERCYLHYKDGSDSCPGGPAPSCESWIGACGSCKQCIDNCRDECFVPCKPYGVSCSRTRGRSYAECECYDEDDGWERESEYDNRADCEADDGCPRDCGSARWDCDNVTEPDKYDCPMTTAKESYASADTCYQNCLAYDCPQTSGKDGYTDANTCNGRCKRDNCDTNEQCRTHYCNTAQSGACWWRDYYESQKKSFQDHKDHYQGGFEKYVDFQNQAQLLECLRADFSSFLSGESDLVAQLKGHLDGLKSDFSALQRVWQRPMPGEEGNYYESLVAKDYVDRIIESKENALNIVKTDGDLDYVESDLAALTRVADELETIINNSELNQQARDVLKTQLINLLRRFVLAVERDIVNPIRDNIGEHYANCLAATDNCSADTGRCPIDAVCQDDERVCPGGAADCFAEEKFCPCQPEELTCPEKNGFLNRIACFERDNGRTFEQLLGFLTTLKNIEDVVLTIPLVADILVSIEPEFRMDPPQLNADVLDQVLDKAKACGIGFLPDTLENLFLDAEKNREKCKQKVSFFQSPQEGARDFSAFRKAILDNPLDSLESKFGAIKTAINNTINPALKAVGPAGKPGAVDKIAQGGVFGSGKTADTSRKNAYTKALNTIKEEFSSLWWDLIWGRADAEELRRACQASSLILDNNPKDIEENCQTADLYLLGRADYDDGTAPDYSDRTLNSLKGRCAALSKLNLDELGTLDAVLTESAEVAAERGCIKEATCNDGGKHCIQCPYWICVNPATGKRGIGAIQKDPLCQEMCADWQPGQNTGYVCDSANNIIWDTAVHGPPASENPSQDICDGLDFNFANCTQNNVNERCRLISDFSNGSDCNLFTSCDPAELQKQLDIQKWRQQSIDNKCPKWFCLNAGGRWQGAAGVSSDSYCQAHCGANDIQGDGMVCNVSDGIIWDTNNNPITGSQVWPPENVSDFRAGQMVLSCIEAQQGLQGLGALDLAPTDQTAPDCSPLQPIIQFCRHKIACETMKNACAAWGVQQANQLAAPLDKPLMQWPPSDPCDNNGFVSGYLGIERECQGSQERMKTLRMFRQIFEDAQDGLDTLIGVDTDGDGAAEPVKDIAGLVHLCNGIAFQEAIKEECDQFDKLRGAFDCSGSGGCDPALRTTIGQFCNRDAVGVVPSELRCSGNRTNFDSTFNEVSPFSGSADAKQRKVDEAAKARLAARKICQDSFSDLRTPLNEVMRVFSILLGIRNYTGAKAGMGGTWNPLDKNSGIRKDSADFWKKATEVYTMIMGEPCADKSECGKSVSGRCDDGSKCSNNILKALSDLWGEEPKWGAGTSISGGFEVTPLMCESRPLVSHTSRGVEKTGPRGGPVCPDVEGFFNQINAKFQLIRQYLEQIDLVRRNATVDLRLGSLKINILNKGDIDPALNEVVKPIYDKAEGIKEKAQLLWAMATAINFANQNCTCGPKSYCPMIWKIPFCISGLPLTAEPIKNAYCGLVWTMRFALGSLTEVLERDLEREFE